MRAVTLATDGEQMILRATAEEIRAFSVQQTVHVDRELTFEYVQRWLWERGYWAQPKNFTWSPVSDGSNQVIAILQTVCGATSERVIQWPPKEHIDVAWLPNVSHQIGFPAPLMNVRRFRLHGIKQRQRWEGEIPVHEQYVEYREAV